MKAIPDRWLQYKPYGTVIENTKFLPFKVPLKTTIKVPPNQEFTIPVLLRAFPKLKFVIDLTNTTRYYSTNDFTTRNVGYLKIMVPGQQVPPKSCEIKFFKAVDKFLATAKDDEVIGVHCTHGLNRTGYLICRYMVERLGWAADDAVKAFQVARGHPIERQAYIDELPSSSIKNIDSSLMNRSLQATSSTGKLESQRPRVIENWRHYPPPDPGFPSRMGPRWQRNGREIAPPPFPPPLMGALPIPGHGFPMAGPRPDVYRTPELERNAYRGPDPRPNAHRIPSVHPHGSFDHTACPPRPVYPGARSSMNNHQAHARPTSGNGFVNGARNSKLRHSHRHRYHPQGSGISREDDFRNDTFNDNFRRRNDRVIRMERRQPSRFSDR
ncbi:RNA/RNP complex-1-interacting phosphatase [Diachasmimorpha longicaudata]|uniref:RNA/RNP complex-1-interacting phosphatase n=1 Tax=Diachasmimorpha longicaudata TaxID=58733 RepID=UPI0030B8893E